MRLRILMRVILSSGSLLLAAANDVPALEDQVLDRINYVRQDPGGYAARLRQLRVRFVGKMLYLPGRENGLLTQEGVGALDEAIAYLESQTPLPPLSRGQLLDLAARDHVVLQGALGTRGHFSPDGASPGDRVARRGGGRLVGEEISYGYADAEDVVRQLVIDDGVADRGHRALLFNRELRYAGVGCGAHLRYGHMCVIDVSRTRNGTSVHTALAQNDGPAGGLPGQP
ncbi:CAP domain-containing protein [Sphingomonas azotifigens]|uniref:CAP domain-containing protein n=1 Tax=Sphingomonas azotifigens TaxID=330920 RepID=UPI001FECCD38|nr:CAP domain-containing protein [Sphingomonas azotifigens]